MTADSHHKPRSKMSALISGGKTSEPAGDGSSPLDRLPHRRVRSVFSAGLTPRPTGAADSSPAPPSPPAEIGTDAIPSAPSGRAPGRFRLKLAPAFWTITGLLSLLVNGILIAILIGLYFNLGALPIGGLLNMGNSLLGGLYSNFELMDRSHITTTIPVESTIPVKFDLSVNQQTNVVLSQDVTIESALVTVQTGGLNITRARTTIVLPQGTILPVYLTMNVPVDTTVPVVLSVPVDIALANTDLHRPFTGLQEVVRPFYCLINTSAVNLDGAPICQQ